jgi:IS30 family transposase
MKHLTQEQRYTISQLLEYGYSIREIAKVIGKNKTTVYREIERNCDGRNGKYNAALAQRKYSQRMAEKPKNIRFTDDIKAEVISMLKWEFSPEQIAGLAQREKRFCVSHEAIYEYIWEDKKKGGNLHKYLRHKGRRYQKRGSAKGSRGIIAGRVDISMRPKIVDTRKRVGDLEIDTIIGRNHKGAILTINERKSGFLWIKKLNSKDAGELAEQAAHILKPHQHWIHTITSDNGKEFAEHQKISEDIKIKFYFAQPYHSWERGSNENLNGLIRQYIPKGSSFENISDEDLFWIAYKINHRPRKRFGYLTPYQKLLLILKNKKVAFVT